MRIAADVVLVGLPVVMPVADCVDLVEIAHDSRFYMELLTTTSARRLAFLNTSAPGAGVTRDATSREEAITYDTVPARH